MDIYDGLDFNPSSTTGNWVRIGMVLYLVSDMFVKKRSTPFGFTVKPSPESSQLKESMDLYEEIVTEEQQSRESTYSEVNHHVLHRHKTQRVKGCQRTLLRCSGCFALS